jgi:hypothetical protein
MKLSVILVSYNSKAVLNPCLKYLKTRLQENFSKDEFEIIIVDNHSQDGTAGWLKRQKGFKTIFLKENIGFGRGNNVGLQIAKGQYILLLNTDVYLKEKVNFQELFSFLKNNQNAAGLTIKLLLANGKIDPASHRGFPTPYNALTYFSGLERLTAPIPGLNYCFGGYHLTYRRLDTVHEIDSPTAAFFLIKKKVLDYVHGFDPDYFFYGEDLDLSYRIKKLGYSLWYYPYYSAFHMKYQSGKKSVDQKTRKNSQKHFYQTMLTFYNKHYLKRYPNWLSALVRLGIKTKVFLSK